MSTWAMFGVAAGLLSLIDPLPYIRDVLRGLTRPHRGSWFIWAVLGATAFASQWAAGASWSLGLVGVQSVGIVIIFGLSITRGEGGLGRWDVVMIAMAGVGILGWALSSEPLVATVCVVAADLLGVLMMLPKTWRDPRSETLATYVLAAAAGLLTTGAVQSFEPALLLYPVYYFVANSLTALVIALRRRMARQDGGQDGRQGAEVLIPRQPTAAPDLTTAAPDQPARKAFVSLAVPPATDSETVSR